MSGAKSLAIAVAIVVLVAGGVAGAYYAGAFRAANPGSATSTQYPVSTAPVKQQSIAQTTAVNGTLGYEDSWTVRGHGSGTITSLPSQGQVISQGQVLYRVDNASPVILLYGTVPDWRTMSAGQTGADVDQLNHDLVKLGYVSAADVASLGWDYFSWETQYAWEQLQEHYGNTSPSASVPLGDIIFEPSAIRVASVLASLGSPAGGAVLSATSTDREVSLSLSAAQESEIKTGDAVTVTLADGSATPGVISSINTIATGSGSNATITVYVTLTRPSASGTLDQEPVQVNITTQSAANALVVPVTALLAQPSGGYAVEVVGAGGQHRLVPVQTGIFDDADGLVQITGAITTGQPVITGSA